jgi:20S proteasome subunit alpha 7
MGVVCKDGIILGTEKIVANKMMISGTDKRIYSVSKNSGGVVNGIIPDGRSVMFRAREECEQYEKNFGIKIPGAVLAERMALQYHQKTMYGGYRPVGSTAIFAVWDMMKGGSLWMIEPSSQMF